MPSTDAIYQITNIGDYTRWVIHGDSTDANSLVDTVQPEQWMTHHSGTWELESVDSDSTVKIKDVRSGYYVTADAAVADTANVKVQPKSSSTLQNWIIEDDPYSYSGFLFRSTENSSFVLSVLNLMYDRSTAYSYLSLKRDSAAVYPKYVFMFLDVRR